MSKDALFCLPESFASRIVPEPNSGCWLWLGGLTHKGYGSFSLERRTVRVHRFTYETLVGPIPDGLQLDHLCRVRSCVNPRHLEPVTCRENIRRSPTAAANRTHCPRGHEYDLKRKDGTRWCSVCRRAGKAAEYQRSKLAIYRRMKREEP